MTCCVCHCEIDPERDAYSYTYTVGAARPVHRAWCCDCREFRASEVARCVEDEDIIYDMEPAGLAGVNY